MAKNEVAVKEAAKLPSSGFDMSRFEGMSTGLEKVTSKDLLVPRLTVIQSNSPQVTVGKPEYNEKYRPGMIYDTGLDEIIEKPLNFLPVHFDKVWIEWFPRETNKGIANIYDNDAIMAQTQPDATGRDVLPNGNYVAETSQIYGLNLNAGMRPSYIAMVSTQLKKSRRWLTQAIAEEITLPDGRSIQAPFFFRSYELGTVPESNAKGSWIGWTIARGKSLQEMAEAGEEQAAYAEQLLARAEKFKKSLDAGEAKADTSSLDGADGGGASSGGGRGAGRGEADNGQAM